MPKYAISVIYIYISLQYNLVGRLLGPKGLTLKRIQAETQTKMSILGRGSMRDKGKEEELRNGTDPAYQHLKENLHIVIEATGPHSVAKLAAGVAEVRKMLIPAVSAALECEHCQLLSSLCCCRSLEHQILWAPSIRIPAWGATMPLPFRPHHEGHLVGAAPQEVRGGKVREDEGGDLVAVQCEGEEGVHLLQLEETEHPAMYGTTTISLLSGTTKAFFVCLIFTSALQWSPSWCGLWRTYPAKSWRVLCSRPSLWP